MLPKKNRVNTCTIARIKIPGKLKNQRLKDEDIINVLEMTALREVLACIQKGQRKFPLETLVEQIIREAMETFAILEVKIDEKTLRGKIKTFSKIYEDSPL